MPQIKKSGGDDTLQVSVIRRMDFVSTRKSAELIQVITGMKKLQEN